jgi:hypothetical protein
MFAHATGQAKKEESSRILRLTQAASEVSRGDRAPRLDVQCSVEIAAK